MKEKSDLFLWTERIGFLMNEKSNLFCDIKKKKKSDLYIKKIKFVFIRVNNIKKKIFLRRGLYS